MTDDRALAQAIVAGDASALRELAIREHGAMLRLALGIVRDRALASEAVQDAWISILEALPTFEGRSSLRTWMCAIVLNRARTLATRAKRTVPISSLPTEPAVDPTCFGPLGFWSQRPAEWDSPEALVGQREVRAAVEACIDELPEMQRAVVTLRDLEGWSSEEVCNLLSLSESNQRVLLHRARSKVRASLEHLLAEGQRR
jgi:RNA polymerase sigma-70 factor, ECF subfamily